MTHRRQFPFFLTMALGAICACGSTSKAPADAAPDVQGDPDAAPPPPLDPKLFDCTSLSKGPPMRRAASTPECLRDPKCTTRLVSAHRGAGGQLGRIAPEDTLAAYRAGIAMGVDLVETDPRPTSDGVLVNITTRRSTVRRRAPAT
jgi:hypothetical protein